MRDFFDNLLMTFVRFQPFSRWCMVIGMWVILITACLQVKQWKEEYKTLGNVPIEDAINVAAMIYLTCMMYKQVNKEDDENDKVKLIKRALREHDHEKA